MTVQHETGLEIVSCASRDISRLVLQAAQFAEPLPQTVATERRTNARHAYPKVISVTPLIDGTLEPASETVSAIGRNLSSGGFDFFHDYLIPERRIVVGLQSAPESWSHFVLELNWTRFVQGGWYISGGKFTQVASWTNSMDHDFSQPSQRDSF